RGSVSAAPDPSARRRRAATRRRCSRSRAIRRSVARTGRLSAAIALERVRAPRRIGSLGKKAVNLVLGATGNNGGEVLRVLRSMKQPVRAIVRDPAKAKGLAGDGVEVAAGDLAEPAGLERAFAGGDALFLLAPTAPNQADLELDALRAARSAGVRRVV